MNRYCCCDIYELCSSNDRCCRCQAATHGFAARNLVRDGLASLTARRVTAPVKWSGNVAGKIRFWSCRYTLTCGLLVVDTAINGVMALAPR